MTKLTLLQSYMMYFARPDESTRKNEEHLKCEIQRLLNERAVLLNETKKQNQILQDKTTTVEEECEKIVGEKSTLIKKVYRFTSEKKLSVIYPFTEELNNGYIDNLLASY